MIWTDSYSAAHAIMPFSGQGHAMAIEDCACLAECLSRTTSTSSIPDALRAFEAIRKPRNKHMGEYSLFNAHTWQLPDGEEQRRRDQRLAKAPMFIAQNWDGKHVDEFPGLPPNPLYYPWMLGHDVVDLVSWLRRSFVLFQNRGDQLNEKCPD